MPAEILFGEARQSGALQPWETTLGAPWLTVENLPWETVFPFIVERPWLTADGDPWLTVQGDEWLALVPDAVPPRYWQAAPITTDGGIPFDFRYRINPWQPSAQGGENVFARAHVAVSWSMAAVLRLTPTIDGSSAAVTLPDGSTLEMVPITFTLPQQSGSLQRQQEIFPVPLIRRQVRDGREISRWYLRGERLGFTVESTGPLGVGELMLEGIELETQPVRKADYAEVDVIP